MPTIFPYWSMFILESDAEAEPFWLKEESTELAEVCVIPLNPVPKSRSIATGLAPPGWGNVSCGLLGEILAGSNVPSELNVMVPVDEACNPLAVLVPGTDAVQSHWLVAIFVYFKVTWCEVPRESNTVTEPLTIFGPCCRRPMSLKL